MKPEEIKSGMYISCDFNDEWIFLRIINVTNENQMGMCWNAKRWVESRFVLGWKPTQFELFIIEALASGKAFASDYEAELKHLYNQLLKLAES